ncbi:MAG: flagellar biosynthesis anti-sigma factor FlgM [Gammaproteobacteria bacterium]
MEVDNNRNAPPVPTGNKNRAQVESQKKDDTGNSSQPSNPSEQVSLTESSRQLQELENLIASQPMVDSKRVDAIREAIAKDNFKVDADSIADKLLRFEQLLTEKL